MRKLYKNRVEIGLIVEIYTDGETEEEAGRSSEDIAEDLARKFGEMLNPTEDGILITYGVRNTEIEPYSEEDEE